MICLFELGSCNGVLHEFTNDYSLLRESLGEFLPNDISGGFIEVVEMSLRNSSSFKFFLELFEYDHNIIQCINVKLVQCVKKINFHSILVKIKVKSLFDMCSSSLYSKYGYWVGHHMQSMLCQTFYYSSTFELCWAEMLCPYLPQLPKLTSLKHFINIMI